MSLAPLPKRALITGAANRIGRAVALDLARHGVEIAIHYHQSANAAESLQQEINALGQRAQCFQADLTDSAACLALIPTISQAFGALDGLINNASLFIKDSWDRPDMAAYTANWHSNCTAPFILTQLFVQQLPAAAAGSIINMIDQRVVNLTPHYASYSLAKAALWAMTQTSAIAYAPRVRVNAIGPGMVMPAAEQSAAEFNRIVANTPLGKISETDEICAAIRWLFSSPTVTGQLINIDSGAHLGWAYPNSDSNIIY